MYEILIPLFIYLAITLFIAWYFSRRESLEEYFVNKQKTGLWFLTFSNVATMIGAGAVIAMVSEIYKTGISYGLALPISMVAGSIILGIVAKRINKIGRKYQAYTIVDFFEKRFDIKNKILVFILQLALLVVWTSLQVLGIAALASSIVGISFNVALLISAIVTVAYTSIGGMKIDIITDFFQFIVMIVVFIVLAIFGYSYIGGFENLLSNIPAGHLNPFAFGGITWFIGVILLGGFFYLGDSSNWQRLVSAKDEKTARKSMWLSIPFFILMGVITIFFGLLASVKLGNINPDSAIFELMKKMLPPALVGVGFASILAIVMSSVDSLLIGGSTIIYKGLFKKNSFDNKKEVLYARIITLLIGILSFGIAFLIPRMVFIALFCTYLATIFSISIIWGMYSKKLSSNAVFYGMLFSTIVLLVGYPLMGANSFIPPLVILICILAFYDKIFSKKDKSLLEVTGFEE